MANSRLIFVPQLPIKMRYQEWWFTEFPKKFREYFDEVVVLGEGKELMEVEDGGTFSHPTQAINFELRQIKEYLEMDHRETDTLLLADSSFPGLFSNVLYHIPIGKRYAICHGTSRNRYDYFCKDRSSKWSVEKGHAKLFDKVFVASEYHRRKLGWSNIHVLPFPLAPFISFGSSLSKVRYVISVSRKGRQKRTTKIEKQLCRDLGIQVYIPDEPFKTWGEYYRYIAESRIMLITSKEETYGYQVFDAIQNGCVPVAPNKFSYSELLPKEVLYDDYEELKSMLSPGGYLRNIKGLCLSFPGQYFYSEISSIMKGERK